MNVLIVVMPFAAVRPAMGASLLLGHLHDAGVSAKVEYFNMDMARRIGAKDYEFIADLAPIQSLAGDWVFAEALFGQRSDADAKYAASFRHRFDRQGTAERSLAALARARAKVDAFLQACLTSIDWAAYDIVGFSSTFTQHVASLALAKRVKAHNPEISIVFGGANCEDVMGLALHRAFPFVDFVCSGEADISFPKLVRALNDGDDPHGIPGVISRKGVESYYSSLHPDRVQDLDVLPYPDFDDFFTRYKVTFPESRGAGRRVLMESSRGCWWGQKHHCTFCGLNGNGMAFRSKSAGRVLEEIDALCQRYAAEHIEMVDNILDMAYLNDLLPEIANRKLHLNLFYETKANLRKDQIRVLSEAGVTAIQPGIESFSTNVLKLMRKGTTAAQNVQLLKWCSEIGMEVCWNLIFGFPGENPADYVAMTSLIDSISHFEPPRGYGPIRLDRFSPNFTMSASLGLTNLRPDQSYTYIYDLPEDQLFDLAYYFEHDYADGRDPNDYVQETVDALRRWHEGYRPHRLVYADHGDCLAIWDLRRAARQKLTILSGIERLVYLYCDQYRSREGILQMLAEASQGLEPLLDRLLEARHLLEVDGHFLGLAVRISKEVRVPATETASTPREVVFF